MFVRHWLGEVEASNFTRAFQAVDGPTEATSGTTHEGVKVVWGCKIPLRDGIRLNGTVYKPDHTKRVLRSPNSIYYQKNYNSGGIVAEERAQDARIAHARLCHDAEHQSFLEIPISK